MQFRYNCRDSAATDRNVKHTVYEPYGAFADNQCFPCGMGSNMLSEGVIYTKFMWMLVPHNGTSFTEQHTLNAMHKVCQPVKTCCSSLKLETEKRVSVSRWDTVVVRKPDTLHRYVDGDASVLYRFCYWCSGLTDGYRCFEILQMYRKPPIIFLLVWKKLLFGAAVVFISFLILQLL